MNSNRITENQLRTEITSFRKAIEANESLSNDFDENLLLRYLKFYNGNVEKALKRLLKTAEIRNTFSNIFFNRDTLDAKLRRLIDQVEMFLLPQLTADNNRVMIFKLIDFDPDSIIFEDALTVFSMVYDSTLISTDGTIDGKLADGEILIFDLNGLTPNHLWRLGLSLLRCFFRYMIEAHPMRINEIHLINCSPMLDKLVLMIRPFVTAAIMKVMHFHLPNAKTLFDYIPRELLPLELNGTGGSLDIPKWYWIRKTEENRSYLLNDELWKLKDRSEADGRQKDEDDSMRYLGFC